MIEEKTELDDNINFSGTESTKYPTTSTSNRSTSYSYEYLYQGTFTVRTDNWDIVTSLDHLLFHITKIISIDMTVATKDDFQDLTAEHTTTPFIQSNISLGEELKSNNGLLDGKEY